MVTRHIIIQLYHFTPIVSTENKKFTNEAFNMIFTKDRKFYSSLLHLAVPMAIGNLVTFLITLTDSIAVGKIGDAATASVFVGGLVATALQMFIAGIEGGVTVGISQYWGKGEGEPIKRIFSIGTILIFLFGVLLALLCFFFPEKISSLLGRGDGGTEYLRLLSFSFPLYALSGAIGAALRGVEAPTVVTIASFTAFVINLFFDVLLIFGKLGFTKMGISGAAIATVIARGAELLILALYLFIKDKRINLRARELLKLDGRISLDFFRYTSPIVLGQLVWIFNTFFSSYVFSSFGSDAVITGLSVANTLNALSYVVMNGLSGAVGIIIGKAVGEGDRKKLRPYAYTTEIIFIILGILTSATLLLVKNPFVSLYNISEQAADVAKSLITVLAFTVIGTSYQAACLLGIVRGGGDTSFILKNDAFFIFLAVIPLTVSALKLGAPLWVVFLALKSDQLLKCIPAAIKINRFHWARDLT